MGVYFVAQRRGYDPPISTRLAELRVSVLAAVKCNTDPVIMKYLVDAGVGFDCATKKEIALMLYMGVDPSRIIYAHTVKCPSYLRWAKEKGVKRMTFDNIKELEKVRSSSTYWASGIPLLGRWEVTISHDSAGSRSKSTFPRRKSC